MKVHEEDIIKTLKKAAPRAMPPRGYEEQLLNSLHARLGLPPRKTFTQRVNDWVSRPMMAWSLAGAFCLAFVVSVGLKMTADVKAPVVAQEESSEVLGIAVDEGTKEVFLASLEDSSRVSARDIAAVSSLNEAALNQLYGEMGQRLEK